MTNRRQSTKTAKSKVTSRERKSMRRKSGQKASRYLKQAGFFGLLTILGLLASIFASASSAETKRIDSTNSDSSAVLFIVNSTADTNNGACTTTAGGCTLREAIIAANANPGRDSIVFDTGTSAPTINVTSALPTITDEVGIAGVWGPTSGGVQLNGENAGAGTNGLRVSAGNSEIRGLTINRFSGAGIRLEGGGTNTILECTIGTNTAGTAALPNGVGVAIINSANNYIGLYNLISGNTGDGIFIDGGASDNNSVAGNIIGTNRNRTAAIPNGANGVIIRNGSNNTIGEPVINGNANIISGNATNGVMIVGANATENLVIGNNIGLNGAGLSDLGNGDNGVYIFNGAHDNVVGKYVDGHNTAYGNIISGNDGDGVRIEGAGTNGNVLAKNVIGLNLNENKAANTNHGVFIGGGASNNSVGDLFWGYGNLISGNDIDGVRIEGATTSGNVVTYSTVGLNSAKTSARPNVANGITILNSPNNQIGTITGFGDPVNTIAGNGANGIYISGATATGNLVRNSTIGGAGALRNVSNGIHISGGAGGSVIGSDNNRQNQNVITGNGGDGIFIDSGLNNRIGTNSISSNSGLGIDLGADGVTANDAGDADAGANNLQNFPVLTAAVLRETQAVLNGTLNSAPNQTYTIQFFASDACDASGFGEATGDVGGGNQVTTDAGGNASFSFTSSVNSGYPGTVAAGKFITAVATNASGSSSELSQCRQVVNEPAGTLQFNSAAYSVAESGGNLTVTVTRTGGANGYVQVNFSTVNATAIAGQDYESASGTLYFGPSETSLTFDVPVNEDTLDEANEAFLVKLINPTGGAALGTPSTSTVTITDNDTAGTLQFSAAAVSVNESAATATVTVTRAGGAASGVSVNYATANGTATAGTDYTNASGTLTFEANETSKTFTVPILEDTRDETNETVTLTLSNPTGGATLGSPNPATLTITDNDATPTLSINNASAVEGNSGASNMTFTVTLSAASGQAVSVNWATANGTAIAPGDYAAGGGALTFNAGETTKQVIVAVVGDTIVEANEAFVVNLSSATNATIADSQGTGTINNDDTCSYTISPTAQSFPASGGSGGVNVTAPVGCAWTAASGAAWLTISGANSGSGNGSVNFSVAANASAGQRAANLTIGGQTFAVTQSAPATVARAKWVDFDGDGKTDISIFRPSAGEWWYLRSGDNQSRAFQFGAGTDKIVPGDYTGDGKTDVAFFRPASGEWFVLRSEDSSFYSFPFGATGDVPVPNDYDGDGKTDAAVFRPSNSTWYVNKSTGGTLIQQFGQTGDVPVVADYDGDAKADIAIYRVASGQWWIQRSSLGMIAFQFGNSADKPVQSDYTSDGKADVAFFRPASGEWFVLRSENQSFYSFPFGASGDLPVAGDYDGDGKSDAAVFRPSNTTWYVQQTTAGTLIRQFGNAGDKPVPNAFVP
jgi:CSLREA domain-containing protein